MSSVLPYMPVRMSPTAPIFYAMEEERPQKEPFFFHEYEVYEIYKNQKLARLSSRNRKDVPYF